MEIGILISVYGETGGKSSLLYASTEQPSQDVMEDHNSSK